MCRLCCVACIKNQSSISSTFPFSYQLRSAPLYVDILFWIIIPSGLYFFYKVSGARKSHLHNAVLGKNCVSITLAMIHELFGILPPFKGCEHGPGNDYSESGQRRLQQGRHSKSRDLGRQR